LKFEGKESIRERKIRTLLDDVLKEKEPPLKTKKTVNQ